jgi:hypothetical protein
LKSIAGSASSPVVIAFDDDATVRVKSSIDLDVYSTVNPEEKKVIFYIGIQDVPGGQLKVKATGAVFNGSVFAPLGQIQVITDGLPSNPAMMTGKFIANKVLATGKHVVWNWSDCSGQELQSLMNPLTEMPVSDKDEGDIALFLYPNPNDGQFKASIAVPVEETFTCFVYNSMGQLIRVIPEIRSEGRIECLIDLRPAMQGIYTVIFQGKDHRMMKKIVVN